MVSKLQLNNQLLEKEMRKIAKTGSGVRDVELSRNRILRQCFNCGKPFTTFKSKNFVFCSDCGKIRISKTISKSVIGVGGLGV